ncbi:MAG: hypothetical protein HND48_02190 [Chloroflexi bacterium]|nr:hypothetical protein [Chloroflexota bacterium]
MAQRPTNGGRKPPGSLSEPTPPPMSRREKLEQFRVSPEFWDTVFDNIPPWTPEVVAVVLIMFGLVSFMALADVSGSAAMARAWGGALTSLFGYGAILVCLGIFALGVWILLPRVGVHVKLGIHRILAIELAFFAVLAMLHLAAGDAEFRAVARAGQGGGAIGGALSSVVTGMIGSAAASLVFAIMLGAAVAVALGFRREHFTRGLQFVGRALNRFHDRTDLRYRYAVNQRRVKAIVGQGRNPTSSLMRIKPNPELTSGLRCGMRRCRRWGLTSRRSRS